MSWTAIVPIKVGANSKTRLRAVLSSAQRASLSEALARHVIECLRASPSITRIAVLSASAPGGAGLRWIHDAGRGLNQELDAARSKMPKTPILVLHADLPLLRVEEVEALLAAASFTGAAIAPDRHATGTNALAIADGRDIRFAFGPDSLEQHKALLGADVRIMQRAGLAFDLDTPNDILALPGEVALRLGLAPGERQP